MISWTLTHRAIYSHSKAPNGQKCPQNSTPPTIYEDFSQFTLSAAAISGRGQEIAAAERVNTSKIVHKVELRGWFYKILIVIFVPNISDTPQNFSSGFFYTYVGIKEWSLLCEKVTS